MARCEKKLEQLMNNNQISNYHDICGDNETSFLFPLILNRLGYLLDSEDMKDFSKSEIKKRRVFNAIVKKIGPLFLMSKQIFEDRAELMGLEKGSMGSPKFPDDKPVIYVANHSFHDDILGTVLAAKRHAYVMFASLPQFYNTIDGPLLYGNGVVLVNRKIKENKSASLGKAKAVLENGCDLIVYPEGVWNKSPNQLCLPLWSGIYRLAKETGAQIVPIVHYIGDLTYTTDKKSNPMHTVIDDAIDVSHLSQEEALDQIRDTIATWHYLMMEKYGKTTRQELLGSFEDSQSAWEDSLRKRVKTAAKYDTEIETTADYRAKNISSLDEVFSPIANLDITEKNAQDVIDAKKLVKEYRNNDFQHRF